MNKMKTYSGNEAHLTEDKEQTLCGKKIYPSWKEADDDMVVCELCEKETEVDGNKKEKVAEKKPARAENRSRQWLAKQQKN